MSKKKAGNKNRYQFKYKSRRGRIVCVVADTSTMSFAGCGIHSGTKKVSDEDVALCHLMLDWIAISKEDKECFWDKNTDGFTSLSTGRFHQFSNVPHCSIEPTSSSFLQRKIESLLLVDGEGEFHGNVVLSNSMPVFCYTQPLKAMFHSLFYEISYQEGCCLDALKFCLAAIEE